ncbi:hypothetical protein P175DRAFT_0531509 [Aspergillus ochraceoroseus IBT 24754]|uniref:Uncharacterized protein n=1 Tax=Aspergillus ochraceoroseus IBT 24754 TaxID=1392256 RepID=A0A2T5M0B5_9EURO|nr:uncharacterized protein P175DRAFT_0531509 [Aspergillus ochraceoroseus IBT 24754]PTU21966.1 hypothetical protein P175DRAFT_0531509 [Aspergillus ochraceoroseus IBT 24754]
MDEINTDWKFHAVRKMELLNASSTQWAMKRPPRLTFNIIVESGQPWHERTRTENKSQSPSREPNNPESTTMDAEYYISHSHQQHSSTAAQQHSSTAEVNPSSNRKHRTGCYWSNTSTGQVHKERMPLDQKGMHGTQ